MIAAHGHPSGERAAPDLTVVVVSYNTVALLRRCLGTLEPSLRRFPPPAPDGSAGRAAIVVVDNASTDGSPEMVRREFPSVGLVALPENRGFAAANNHPLRTVESRAVLLLNPDTEVLGDAPAALLRFLDAHPRVGVVGGQLLYPDLRFQHSCFRFPTLPMTFLDLFPLHHRLLNGRVNGRYPRGWYRRPFPCDHPLGAAMLVRRETMQQVGLFDEGYFMYCEEVDWCYRIKQAGWEIWYTPTAQIIHHAGASTRQHAGPMLVELHRSRDRFFRKHYGDLYASVARQIVRLGMERARAGAQAAARSGQIDATELARQLAVFAEVGRGEGDSDG
jgi:N-acetylglucosaminyl-diphospho-decaprenol L-rhamnosyltransferase